MTEAQQKDLFTERAFYGPREQKKMIDEYHLSVSAGNCSLALNEIFVSVFQQL